MWLWILIAVLVVIVLWIVSTYNSLVGLRNTCKEAFSTMDVYLKKRWDLIPNLVETVKGYAKHEKDTLQEVISLRNTPYESMSDDEKVKTNQKLSQSVTKIMALAEAYPELKADTEYLNLQSELSIVEDQLKDAREIYNHVANNYNTAIEVVPSNIVAAIFGFKKAELFKLEDAKKENVEIKL